MTTYTFSWEVFVTPEIVTSVADAAGAQPTDEIAPLLAAVLDAVGGLPLSERAYSADERTAMASGLLHEAVRHVGARLGRTAPVGRALVKARADVEGAAAVVAARPRVPLNTADEDQLVALPVIGPVIARRIIAERLARGPFASLSDLDARVPGLGAAGVAELEGLVSTEPPSAQLEPRFDGDLTADLGALVRLVPAATPEARLRAALEILAESCAGDSHPATAHGMVRSVAASQPDPAMDAAWAATLFGPDYYDQLPGLLASAQSRIDVCMFHIAFPSQAHPTRTLLDALVGAKDRGVAVRVLVDQDRETDPYKSTVINSAAREYLADHGVPCRADTSDRLLHSKVLTIDDSLALVGSHNWSAGSYSGFDDLTLVVRSAELVVALRARFDALWGP